MPLAFYHNSAERAHTWYQRHWQCQRFANIRSRLLRREFGSVKANDQHTNRSFAHRELVSIMRGKNGRQSLIGSGLTTKLSQTSSR